MPNILFNITSKYTNEQVPVYTQQLENQSNIQNLTDNYLDGKFGTLNKRRTLDNSYNCHGMVYANRMGFVGIDDSAPRQILLPGQSNNIIDTNRAQTELLALLSGNGLRIVGDIPNIMTADLSQIHPNIKCGDIVTYFSEDKITHSCIIYTIEDNQSLINIRVLSKLGQAGEYFHKVNDPSITEIYGSRVKLWTDR